jgi:hypothetical protein
MFAAIFSVIVAVIALAVLYGIMLYYLIFKSDQDL